MQSILASHNRRYSITHLLMAIFIVVWSGGTQAADFAVCNQCRVRPGDEYWEISSRALPNLEPCTTISPVVFRVSTWDGCCWNASDTGQFQASFADRPTMRTVLYSHGNWMTYENSHARAAYVYSRVSQRANEPIRFIAYTWPSQRTGRPVRDVYEKADRSNTDTFYFAHLLSSLPEESPLGIIGFSFGGRVVCGGLHMVSGGRLEGRNSPVWTAPRQVRLGLIAPAFDRTWLVANHAYGEAIENVERVVNIYNSRDPVLRRFRFLDRVSAPIAAGFTGLADPRATEPLRSDERIRQFDCCEAVGSSHDEMTYYQKCCHYNILIDNVLGK